MSFQSNKNYAHPVGKYTRENTHKPRVWVRGMARGVPKSNLPYL